MGFAFASLGLLVAGIVEIYRLKFRKEAGDYYDVAARDNITPCQNIDDYNPYLYQKWWSSIDGASKPTYCRQTCDDTYDENGTTYLQLYCISCDDIPQMSDLSVFWQVSIFPRF